MDDQQKDPVAKSPAKGSSRWRPGQSGNPSGRPRGTSPVASVRGMLQPHRDKLIAKAVQMALEGNPIALRLCLDRCAPAPKSESEPVVIEGLMEAATLAEKATVVINAAGAGKISADAAASFLGAIASACRIKEFDELERRITELEKGVAQ